MTIGQKIKALREAAGFTKAELSRRAGVSAGFVGNLEKDIEDTMSEAKAKAFAAALSVPPQELLRLLPRQHPAKIKAETEVPDLGVVWGARVPPDVPEPEPGKMFPLIGRYPPGTFVLRVSGHSVHRYGVHDGDVIAVRPTEQEEDGSLVILRQGNAYTLKGCRGKKLFSFGVNEDEPMEMDGSEPYHVVGVMIGLVDGERRFLPRAGVIPKRPKKK